MSLRGRVAYWEAQKVLNSCVNCDYYPICWTRPYVCYNEEMIRKVCNNSKVKRSIEFINQVLKEVYGI